MLSVCLTHFHILDALSHNRLLFQTETFHFETISSIRHRGSCRSPRRFLPESPCPSTRVVRLSFIATPCPVQATGRQLLAETDELQIPLKLAFDQSPISQFRLSRIYVR